MKALGIVRNIDNLGRIVIPKEVRKANGWGINTPMEMFASEEGLMIRPYKPSQEKYEIINQLYDVYQNTENEEVFAIIGRAIDFVKQQ